MKILTSTPPIKTAPARAPLISGGIRIRPPWITAPAAPTEEAGPANEVASGAAMPTRRPSSISGTIARGSATSACSMSLV
ncbi:hypothetical protein VQ03_07415 [Methylobacterium tarhaniae]|uniref:Uncharacterized protein n=1 Tax=Methylobacterium tarhaniae TaxID=1187852 RepID=A0A0J6TCQ0_9HYPH|nr:hypothetical protein VQ03_07415 [Methylobacterium tarhaniae]